MGDAQIGRSGTSIPYEIEGKRIFVAGHRGMVGSAIARRLVRENCEVLTTPRPQLDLMDQMRTDAWFAQHKPHAVFMAAGKVGGIIANNTLRADFIYENLVMAANVIHAAFVHGAEKLMFFGSTCIYPRLAPQPISETCMLTGPLEPTNEPYAVAKIAGIKLAEAYRDQHGADFISVMPTNLFGPGDNYHPEHSHVVAALIRRFHEAKIASAPEVVVWGTGAPRREFLYVDDLADASVFLMKSYSDRAIINIGTGDDIAISEFARVVADVVGYRGKIFYDTARPDGMPGKLVDGRPLNALGGKATTGLHQGLRVAYEDFLNRQPAR